MIDNNELLNIGVAFILISTLTYKLSFFHHKKIAFIPLIQLFNLIILPGVIYTIVFSYVLEIVDRPLNENNLFSDKLLLILFLLSMLYTYGGIAIHTLTKTLSSYFKPSDKTRDLFQVNSFFHLGFSHNLTFIGAFVSAGCFALLELNHQSPYPAQSRFIFTILGGIFLGLTLIASLALNRWYKRWADLKYLFFTLWVLFIIILYALKPYIKNVKAYPITLVMLISFAFVAALSLFLSVRKYKNKIKLVWQIPKDLFS